MQQQDSNWREKKKFITETFSTLFPLQQEWPLMCFCQNTHFEIILAKTLVLGKKKQLIVAEKTVDHDHLVGMTRLKNNEAGNRLKSFIFLYMEKLQVHQHLPTHKDMFVQFL